MPKGIYPRTELHRQISRDNWKKTGYTGKKEPRVCEVCGSSFYEFTNRILKGFGRFCSTKCNGIYKKNLWIDKTKHPRWNSVKVKCEVCGKDFWATPYRLNKGADKFCSRKCYEISKRKDKILTHCIVCGKERWRYPCEIELGKRFCSRHCSALYNLKFIPRKDTSIELKLEAWLRENKVAYKKQVRIKNISVVDFFIEPNICLFADGDYWHSPKLNKGKDERQNIELKQNGYDVVRLWEKDINAGKRPVNILEKINAQ